MPRYLQFFAFGSVFLLLLAALAYGVGGLRALLSIEGLLIVVGGSVVNAFLSFERDDVMKAFRTLRSMFHKAPPVRERLKKDLAQVVGWAYVVQSQDFLGLEKETARTVKEPLLRYGIELVVTGYGADKIREMLNNAVEAEFERRCTPVTVLRNMAAAAPAFGMVGTLIGMATMLQSSGTDITRIGGGLAVAMLSTLYGILIARLFCLPAADKLLQREEARRFRHYMLAEGLALLAEKQNPLYVQDRLHSFLDPTTHAELHKPVPAAPKPLAMAA